TASSHLTTISWARQPRIFRSWLIRSPQTPTHLWTAIQSASSTPPDTTWPATPGSIRSMGGRRARPTLRRTAEVVAVVAAEAAVAAAGVAVAAAAVAAQIRALG